VLCHPIHCRVWFCGQARSKQGENAMGAMWGCNGSEGQPRAEAVGRGQDRCLTSRRQGGLLLWVMVLAVGASGCRPGSGGTGDRAGRLPRAGASNRATARPASKRAQAARGRMLRRARGARTNQGPLMCRTTKPGAAIKSEGKDLDAWTKKRMERAASGQVDFVRIRLVRHSLGWGCDCPYSYIGEEPDSHAGESYLEPEPESLLPKAEREGWSRTVIGYFWGTSSQYSSDDEGSGDVHQVADFHVVRVLGDSESEENHLAQVVGVCRARWASPARQPARVVSPRPVPSRVPPHARPRLPAWTAQFSRPCHVKRAVRKEIQRLLDEAAAHASWSSACMDGPGKRMTVDQVAVCRGPRHGRRWQYYVRYRVTRSREGDTRMCGRRPGDCAWRIPVSSVQYTVLSFSLLRHRRMRIVLPKVSALSGLEDATPLDKPHNGRCYGKRGPFKARTLRR